MFLHKISFLISGKWNPNDYHIDELFKASLAILELGMLEPRAQILGGVVIWDLAGLSLHHAWQITPSVASKVIELMMVWHLKKGVKKWDEIVNYRKSLFWKL